ncbi:MAG: M14 family zinc carboxypeptidase [Solirubrobacterales bacterium]
MRRLVVSFVVLATLAAATAGSAGALDQAEAQPPAPSTERISLESVAISGTDDLARLEQLGLDVTENVSPGAATVVLYSDAERALVDAAGLDTTTLTADMLADSRADRRAERRRVERGIPSDLPSGRNDYRVYSDYTEDLQQLADENPGLVRPLVLGQSIDGVPIEGVEIATGVNRTDDGRPVYLNMGLHHAREWPSGEFPMEFAIDLVDSFNGGDPRITALLNAVRVVIVPVVNPDGFIVSRAGGLGELRRKNCRPTLGDAAIPCESRLPTSGVDLNRNYGAYWGGSGSNSMPSSDAYRGPAPYSEPESEAVHQFTSRLHPTVFITNHTFTDDGKWLRQPGFDDPDVFPQDSIGSFVPDEPAMKQLGDAMGDATGWTSERAYETLGDITGATEDWNYFSQGTYGYTPEARGEGFHDMYQDAVVEEYVGDAQHQGLGVRQAFLLAGEVAADPTHHSVVAGPAPAGGELGLTKAFATETSQPGLVVNDVLDTRLTVSGSGAYEWHTNPSGRPLFPGERWTMTCAAPSGTTGSTQVAVARGQRVIVNWSKKCKPSGAGKGRCAGKRATIVGGPDADVLRGTPRRDVIAGKGGRDRIRARGGNDLVCGGAGADRLFGQGGKDRLKGGGGKDRLRGGGGRDKLSGGGGRDRLAGGPGRDRLAGGPGRDRCKGGGGKDKLRGCE